MKKLKTKLLMGLLAVSAFTITTKLYAQNTLPGVQWYYAKESTKHPSTHHGEDWFYGVKSVADGNFIGTGYSEIPYPTVTSATTVRQPTIVKVDKNGNFLWETIIIDNNYGVEPSSNTNGYGLQIIEDALSYIIFGKKIQNIGGADRLGHFSVRLNKTTGVMDAAWGVKYYNTYTIPGLLGGTFFKDVASLDYSFAKEIKDATGTITGFIISSDVNTTSNGNSYAGLSIKLNATGAVDAAFGSGGVQFYFTASAGNYINPILKNVTVEYDASNNPIAYLYTGRIINSSILPFTNDVLLFKTDLTGTILWQKIFTKNTVGIPYIDLLDNVACGTSAGNKTDEESGVYLEQLTAGGDFVMVAQFNINGSVPSSGCVSIALNTYAQGYLQTDPAVIRFNTSGNFIWAKNIPNSTGIDYFNPLKVLPGGTALVVGGSDATSNLNIVQPQLSKLDASGNILWTKNYFDNVNQEVEVCLFGIDYTLDNGYLIGGNNDAQINNQDEDYEMIKTYDECSSLQTYDINGLTVNASTTINWNSNHSVIGIVTIASGGVLNITGAATTIQFADSKASGIPTKIIVKPGGKLNINGATLTSVLACPNTIWNGIEVEGNYNKSQALSGGAGVFQGFVNITNGGTISNARLAILTATTLSNNFADGTKTGGIVIANNANFINNMGDVAIFSYHSPNGGNLSSFVNCNFKINAPLLDGGIPQYRAALVDVDGIKFTGCNFENTTGNFNNSGYGIYASDANFFVDQINASSPSKVTGFDNGIYVSNSNPLRVPSIKNTSFFDNYYNSTYINNVTTPVFEYNYVRTSSIGGAGTGLYLNNCKNYNVNNNTFLQNPALVDGGDVGMYVNNSQAGAHSIYRNNFNNFAVGIGALNNNSGTTNNLDGLKMNCNDFTSQPNGYDVALMGTSPTVMRDQGAVSSNANTLVRNRYAAPNSCSGCEVQWYIQGTSAKIVNHAANSDANTRPTPQPLKSDIAVNVTSGPPFNPSHCPSSNIQPNPSCPCAGCCRLAEINSALNSVIQQKNSVTTTYTNSIDGGSTQNLLNAINGNMSNGNLKNLLQSNSPYLSDTVLKTYFSKTSTPNGHIKDIHGANAPVSAPVWQVITNLNLPNGIQNQINTAQNATNISARTTLEAQVNLANFNVQDVASQKLNYFLTDSLPASKDSVILQLNKNIGQLQDTKTLLVYAYLNKGDIDGARKQVADIQTTQTKFAEYLNKLIDIQTSPNKAFSLKNNPADVAFFTNYASKESNPGFYGAQSLLQFVMGIDYYIPYLKPQQGNNARLTTPDDNTVTNQLSDLETFNVKLYPNPTTGILNLFINTVAETTNKKYEVVVSDITGKQVYKTTLENKQQLQLPLNNLSAGVYLLFINDGKQSIYQSKVVKLN